MALLRGASLTYDSECGLEAVESPKEWERSALSLPRYAAAPTVRSRRRRSGNRTTSIGASAPGVAAAVAFDAATEVEVEV